MAQVHSLPVKGLSLVALPMPPGMSIIAPGVGVHVGSGVNVGKANINVGVEVNTAGVQVGSSVTVGVNVGGAYTTVSVWAAATVCTMDVPNNSGAKDGGDWVGEDVDNDGKAHASKNKPAAIKIITRRNLYPFIVYPLFLYHLKKKGKRPEGLSGSTRFFEETFGTVCCHPQVIEKIPFLLHARFYQQYARGRLLKDCITSLPFFA